jgi:CheY-like chemotaxis protein
MEAIGQLTGGVAHDFNNLLTVILGNLDNLQRHLPDNAEAQHMVAAITRASSRAATLTHRLLAFARRQPLEPKPVEVNRLVAGMSDLLRRSLGEGIVIDTVLAGGLWRTLADPYQLESALLNLAVNARDAMPSGGRLTIETSNTLLDENYAAANEDVRPGQYVLVAVSDTGTGMAKDVMERAFEPFFTTKEVGQGTGLGLSQVYGFVKQSGGHVKIYTEPGEGTTVKLYLPRLAGAEAESDVIAEAAPLPASVPGETVLVVEDDPDVRAYGADILRGLGYRVIEAPSGPAALRVVEEEPELRLLFTDVGLPGGYNGRQLADEARRRRPDLKVLFTTGYARNAIVHQGRLDPGVALIAKPFTAASLGAKVRQVLTRG